MYLFIDIELHTDTPGLHNKIPPHKIFARVWIAQELCFTLSTLRFSRVWVRKDGNLVMETGCDNDHAADADNARFIMLKIIRS